MRASLVYVSAPDTQTGACTCRTACSIGPPQAPSTDAKPASMPAPAIMLHQSIRPSSIQRQTASLATAHRIRTGGSPKNQPMRGKVCLNLTTICTHGPFGSGHFRLTFDKLRDWIPSSRPQSKRLFRFFIPRSTSHYALRYPYAFHTGYLPPTDRRRGAPDRKSTRLNSSH